MGLAYLKNVFAIKDEKVMIALLKYNVLIKTTAVIMENALILMYVNAKLDG